MISRKQVNLELEIGFTNGELTELEFWRLLARFQLRRKLRRLRRELACASK